MRGTVPVVPECAGVRRVVIYPGVRTADEVTENQDKIFDEEGTGAIFHAVAPTVKACTGLEVVRISEGEHGAV